MACGGARGGSVVFVLRRTCAHVRTCARTRARACVMSKFDSPTRVVWYLVYIPLLIRRGAFLLAIKICKYR